jgi:hypothetical protein
MLRSIQISSRIFRVINIINVVEAGHAHVMKFFPLSVNCQFLSLSLSFLGEKCGDEDFIDLFFLN